jgi:peptide/nickel transport system permease protein
VRRELGLDQPIYIQYARWLGRVLQGDFGTSFASKQPALSLLTAKLPATVLLTVGALVIGLLIALPVGILSGIKPNSWIDYLASSISLLGIALPTFWFGMMLVLAFGVQLKLLPPGGYVPLADDALLSLKHLALPALTLGLNLAATQTRFIRSGMIDVMRSDYITTARAKGLAERIVISRHALKNAMLTVVTVLALDIGALLGGAIITEAVFTWPGVGSLLVSSVNSRDYPVLQAVILFTVVVYVTINSLVDVLYAYLDPRIRFETH